jgi:hypothetical protein
MCISNIIDTRIHIIYKTYISTSVCRCYNNRCDRPTWTFSVSAELNCVRFMKYVKSMNVNYVIVLLITRFETILPIVHISS